MTKTVLMLTPGYPGEMPYFTRGLSMQGAQVLGVADGPAHDLPEMARRHLSDYLALPGLFTDTNTVMPALLRWIGFQLMGANQLAMGPRNRAAHAGAFRSRIRFSVPVKL